MPIQPSVHKVPDNTTSRILKPCPIILPTIHTQFLISPNSPSSIKLQLLRLATRTAQTTILSLLLPAPLHPFTLNPIPTPFISKQLINRAMVSFWGWRNAKDGFVNFTISIKYIKIFHKFYENLPTPFPIHHKFAQTVKRKSNHFSPTSLSGNPKAILPNSCFATWCVQAISCTILNCFHSATSTPRRWRQLFILHPVRSSCDSLQDHFNSSVVCTSHLCAAAISASCYQSVPAEPIRAISIRQGPVHPSGLSSLPIDGKRSLRKSFAATISINKQNYLRSTNSGDHFGSTSTSTTENHLPLTAKNR